MFGSTQQKRETLNSRLVQQFCTTSWYKLLKYTLLSLLLHFFFFFFLKVQNLCNGETFLLETFWSSQHGRSWLQGSKSDIMAALLCRIADSQEPRLVETQQTRAFFFFPPARIDDEVCMDLFPEGQSCSLGEVQLWLAKEDVEDKGQLSSRTHSQVMAADAGGGGGSKQTSVNRPGGPFCPGCAVWVYTGTECDTGKARGRWWFHAKIHRFIQCFSRNNNCWQTSQRRGVKSILYSCCLLHFSERDGQNTDCGKLPFVMSQRAKVPLQQIRLPRLRLLANTGKVQ